ncbi:MAG: UDP-3-O-acyl-N-acetylglucosamine deacetylase [Deltaproteobacteria bacterium]|nr:UDP-3-O-acyl-N-acetylglucosamine deacetylase [Deltaproteobacteria bacterium]
MSETFQTTVKRSVHLKGVALHTGETVRMRIAPAPADAGIRFVRTDLSPAVEIPAESRFVTDTTLATVLGRDGIEVSTVEHCLAALAGLGVDNARIEVDGPELPILDGSALPYVEAVLAAGVRLLGRPRRTIRIEKPVRVRQGDKFCLIRPGRGFRVTYSIDFDGRFPGSQHFFLDVTPERFAEAVAPARTFGFLHEVEFLRRNGKARGGSLENAVVVEGDRVLNPEGLRMPDEPVRHKILDAVGDLALMGHRIEGHLIVHKGGHALHDQLVKALLSRPDAWSYTDPDPRAPWRPAWSHARPELAPAPA